MTRKRGSDSSEPIRFAVVGQGYFAQSAILPAFANARGAKLQAIFSDDPTKLRALGRRYRVADALPYGDYDSYLRGGEVDAVYIALPNDEHREYAVRAAAAHVHVLCEKPLAVNSAEAERIVDACRENDVRLMTAYRLHFEAANLAAVEAIRKGTIGRARFLSTTFAMQVSDDNVRTQRQHGGGPLLDLGIYCVNAARYLFRAEPTEAVAFSASRTDDRRFKEIDEQVTAILRFPEERLAQLTCSFGGHDHSSLQVVGDKGQLTLDSAYENASGITLEIAVGERKLRRKTFPKRDQVAAELMAFVASVRAGKDPEPSGKEGLADMRVLDAISRSLESGRAVPVDGVPRGRRPSERQRIDRPPHDMPPLVHVEPPGQ